MEEKPVDYKTGYKKGVQDCLDGMSTYLMDIFEIRVAEHIMTHLINELKEDGVITEN